MIEVSEILQTIRMVSEQHFDIRTITMGISLLDCKKNTDRETAQAVYDKVTRVARDLVRVGGELESELGVPIVNKRISVTPVGMICGDDPVAIAMALDEAAGTVGVNFIGGYGALMHKGATRAEETLLDSMPEAFSKTARLCGSVNVGSTRSGINMDVESLPARINDLADQIEAEYAAGKNEGKKPRILVTGSPSGGAALKVIRAIEDAGAVVVAFENCSGLKSMLLTDEENPDVYDALARRYLGIGCSCMSPNPNRLAMLDKLIDEFHVDGVVDIILQACHTYNVETALVGKLVKEKKGIPYTVVETDYSQSDVGQIQTRMAAFVEML